MNTNSKITREEAHRLLEEAGSMNPGKWVDHSKIVASIAERLADKLGLDKEKAYIGGLLHDIGRRNGVTGNRHIIDGHTFLTNLGYEDIARYCITHSYFIKNIKYAYGKNDMTNEERDFVQNYLDSVEYDLYDKLVQIGDCMGLPEGITTLERRVMDVNLRYGIAEFTVEDWQSKFKLQSEIETLLGYSIYKVFPEVKESLSKHFIKDLLTF
jgi:uncharacterized domain HDIG